MKTFYIETFGCQMNAHDSEKVVGTLVHSGYTQVDTPESAGLVVYNTCSIRDKAEQKVFHRLDQFKRAAGKGRVFAVIGCVAQQEGERIFEKAQHVSLVCGSTSYTKLPELLVQLEPGNRRVTGLSLDTDETFDTPLTRRDNPHRAYITIIEGCDKSCAYCVVPFTRGPERSRTSESVLKEARELARMGYTEIQLLGQNVNSYRDPSPAGWDFARLLRACGEIDGLRRVRFTTSHPRDFVKEISDAIDEPPAQRGAGGRSGRVSCGGIQSGHGPVDRPHDAEPDAQLHARDAAEAGRKWDAVGRIPGRARDAVRAEFICRRSRALI